MPVREYNPDGTRVWVSGGVRENAHMKIRVGGGGERERARARERKERREREREREIEREKKRGSRLDQTYRCWPRLCVS
jgi:hypothetical protein